MRYLIILSLLLTFGCIFEETCTMEVKEVCFTATITGHKTCGYSNMAACLADETDYAGICQVESEEVCK